MPCDPELLKQVPLFSLLDDEETAVLASQVETREFVPRQRVFKTGEPGGRGYVVVSGSVEVVAVDRDNQEIVIDQPGPGEIFGFASMLSQSPHQTEARTKEQCVCIEVDREDLFKLVQQRPHAGMDLLTVLGNQIHAAHDLARSRAMRNANEMIEEETRMPQRIADGVARFGGSWAFILSFGAILIVYSTINVLLGKQAWDPYPFILLNLFLSMLAAIQAPVIMMSQNRQDQKDRVRSELDFEVNRRAESEVQALAGKMNLMSDKISDLEDLLRDHMTKIDASQGKH